MASGWHHNFSIIFDPLSSTPCTMPYAINSPSEWIVCCITSNPCIIDSHITSVRLLTDGMLKQIEEAVISSYTVALSFKYSRTNNGRVDKCLTNCLLRSEYNIHSCILNEIENKNFIFKQWWLKIQLTQQNAVYGKGCIWYWSCNKRIAFKWLTYKNKNKWISSPNELPISVLLDEIVVEPEVGGIYAILNFVHNSKF